MTNDSNRDADCQAPAGTYIDPKAALKQLRDGAFQIMPAWLMARPEREINQGAKLCYCRLVGYYNAAKGAAWPSMDRLAADFGVSSRQAIKYIAELERVELITVQRDPGRGNRYRFLSHVWMTALPNDKGEPAITYSAEKGGPEVTSIPSAKSLSEGPMNSSSWVVVNSGSPVEVIRVHPNRKENRGELKREVEQTVPSLDLVQYQDDSTRSGISTDHASRSGERARTDACLAPAVQSWDTTHVSDDGWEPAIELDQGTPTFMDMITPISHMQPENGDTATPSTSINDGPSKVPPRAPASPTRPTDVFMRVPGDYRVRIRHLWDETMGRAGVLYEELDSGDRIMLEAVARIYGEGQSAWEGIALTLHRVMERAGDGEIARPAAYFKTAFENLLQRALEAGHRDWQALIEEVAA